LGRVFFEVAAHVFGVVHDGRIEHGFPIETSIERFERDVRIEKSAVDGDQGITAVIRGEGRSRRVKIMRMIEPKLAREWET
jgi:hypothetical protein